jgi:hypothetical protein
MYESLVQLDYQVLQLMDEMDIEPTDLAERKKIIDQLLNIPINTLIEGFGMVQYITSQTGCPNICDFCSQGAATDVWRLDSRSLLNVFSAFKTVDHILQEQHGAVNSNSRSLLANSESRHKPGVVFLYHDTDVASDINMYTMVKHLYNDFGLKSRVSTVSWSRHNEGLNLMHQMIAEQFPDAIDGFRVSITPYTDGVTERGSRTSKEEYIADVANLLTIYTPLIEKIGIGKNNFGMELRFAPMVHTQDNQILDTEYKGRHLIKVGDLLAISSNESQELKTTEIIGFDNKNPEYSEEGVDYIIVRNNSLNDESLNVFDLADEIIDQQNPSSLIGQKIAKLYRFINIDGPYYAFDPKFNEEGFRSIHIYPETLSRKAGFNDATRYFLNAVIEYKKEKGLSRKADFSWATWEDVNNLLDIVEAECRNLEKTSLLSANHIRSNILPIISMQAEILKLANFPPSLFFDTGFTVDTGQIVNQGRAIRQFKGLVSTPDTPMNPHEERGYGINSFASRRGNVWKISPLPNFTDAIASKIGLRNKGMKDKVTGNGKLMFSPLDWKTLSPIVEQAYTIDGVKIDRVTLKHARGNFLLPGLRNE